MGGCLALALSGCAGYRLGPLNGLASGKSVQVRPFQNQTLEPRLTDAVTAGLREELQRDRSVTLATRDDGDIVVSGVITRYQRLELTTLRSDALTGHDFRLRLTAHVIARERSSGKVILDKTVEGFTLVRAGNDLTSSEAQGLPLLATDLAKNVTALLVEGGW
jgi:hypothetical protein